MWSPLADFWKAFTETLNTRGGTIALLFVCNVGLFFGVLHILHTGDESNAAAILNGTFNAFNGALLIALTTGGTQPKPPTEPPAK